MRPSLLPIFGVVATLSASFIVSTQVLAAPALEFSPKAGDASAHFYCIKGEMPQLASVGIVSETKEETTYYPDLVISGKGLYIKDKSTPILVGRLDYDTRFVNKKGVCDREVDNQKWSLAVSPSFSVEILSESESCGKALTMHGMSLSLGFTNHLHKKAKIKISDGTHTVIQEVEAWAGDDIADRKDCHSTPIR